jgi:hypothetical protein
MSNGIGIAIFGIDRLTGQIGGWAKGWHKQLGSVAGSGTSSISQMGRAISGLSFAGAIAGAATLAATVKGVTDGLADAASKQTQLIASSSDLSQTLGIPLARARALNESTQAGLARIAADLPGVTADYVAIQNSLTGTFGDMFRGDEKGFQTGITDFSKRVGVLSSIRQLDASMSGSAINRLLSGTSGFGEISQVDIFQKNPMLIRAIRNSASQMGLDVADFKEWTQQQRYQVLDSALKFAAPDSLMKEFTGTTESILQGIQTNLFDPILGTFGFLRRIAGKGNRTALDAFAGYLQSFMALMDSLGKLGDRLGIRFDPMEALISFFDGVADFTNRLAQMVDGARLPELQTLDINGALKGFWNGLATLVDPANIGNMMPWVDNAINSIVNGINTFIDMGVNHLVNGDPAAIGYSIGRLLGGIQDLLNRVGMSLLGGLSRINWLGVVNILLLGVTNSIIAFVTLVAGYIGRLGDNVSGMVSRMTSSVVQPAIANIGKAIARLLNSIPSFLDGALSAAVPGYGVVRSFLGSAPAPTAPTSNPFTTGTATPSALPLTTPNVATSTTSSSVFAPTVNVNGATFGNDRAATDNIMQRLEQLYQDSRQQSLLQPGF